MYAVVAQKPKFSVAMQTDGYKKLINNTLQDPQRASQFIAAISSVVSANPALQECDAGTILAGALLGEALKLPPSPSLGRYYLVPFKKNRGKKDEYSVATFILGYKGYIELAIRSGQYKNITAKPVKKGEIISIDDFNEEYIFKPLADPVEREAAETIGYYAMLEYTNGFRKQIYWSKQKMLSHGKRYSKAFHTSDSFWQKDFDSMALKTMLRQLISKWGVMSIDMVTAINSDNRIINPDLTPDYLSGPDINDLAGDVYDSVEAATSATEDVSNDDPAIDTVSDAPLSGGTISMSDL